MPAARNQHFSSRYSEIQAKRRLPSARPLSKCVMPKFEMPKFEVPPAFREFAEKGVAQAKENYEKVKTAAEQAISSRTPIPQLQKAAPATASRLSKRPAPTATLPSI